jgi:hypothetical protein
MSYPALAQGAFVFSKPVKDFLLVRALLYTTKAVRIRRPTRTSILEKIHGTGKPMIINGLRLFYKS